MNAPLPSDAYARASGQVCPACGGTDLARGRFDAHTAARVTRLWACDNCGATWVAVYELAGYEDLQHAEETT